MVTATAMAIFAGDIPGALLRIPGTPASAAYCDEAYAMTRNGEAVTVLGAGLVFSVIGGLFGTVVLVTTAPALAEVALKFSSFEYFWLVTLGLTCAVFISPGRPLKGLASLLIGLLIATVGFENPAAYPRFTFGSDELMSGFQLTPVMIGMFAGECRMRAGWPLGAKAGIGRIFRGRALWPVSPTGAAQCRHGDALPGAGADIAAWISYGLSKRFSRTPEKFGTGHVEGIIESGAANNSALAGAWIPALVFGIPGDSITAIVIGVLYMKGMNPGPALFIENPQNIYAVFIVFVFANLLLPRSTGWRSLAKNVLQCRAASSCRSFCCLRRGCIRDQQRRVRRCSSSVAGVRDGGEPLSNCTDHPRPRARRMLGKFRDVADEGRRQAPSSPARSRECSASRRSVWLSPWRCAQAEVAGDLNGMMGVDTPPCATTAFIVFAVCALFELLGQSNTRSFPGIRQSLL